MAAGLDVSGRSRAHRCRIDVVGARALVTAPHEDVQRRQLAHHLRQHVGQLGAIGDAIHQRRVLRAHGRPVHAVHLSVVEVVALEAPAFGEHLPPLVARVQPEPPVADGEHLLGQFGRRRGFGARIEHEVVLLAPHQDLLAIGRQLVTPDVLEKGLELGLVGVDGQRLERPLALRLGVAVEQVEALGVDRQAGVVARRHGHFDQPRHQIREVDLAFVLRSFVLRPFVLRSLRPSSLCPSSLRPSSLCPSSLSLSLSSFFSAGCSSSAG